MNIIVHLLNTLAFDVSQLFAYLGTDVELLELLVDGTWDSMYILGVKFEEWWP